MLLAVMDLGSNSFKMTVAQWAPELSRSKPFVTVHKERHPIQLGKSVFSQGRISERDFKAGLKALKKMQARLKDFSSPVLKVVATSAIRDASNGRDFVLQARSELGLPIQVISGAEEASLIASGLEWEYRTAKRGLLIDIGGGSTEIASFGSGWKTPFRQSLRMGSVRATVQYFGAKSHVSELEIRQKLRAQCRFPANLKPKFVVGSAGTIQSIGKILCDATDKKVISLRKLDAWIAKNWNKKSDWVETTYGIQPSRARVVVAGAFVLSEVMRALKISQLSLTSMTLRDGVLVKLVQAWESKSSELQKMSQGKRVSGQRVSLKSSTEKKIHVSLEQTAQRFSVDLLHARHVAALGLSVMEQMNRGGARFQAGDRRLYLAASYLHDIGQVVSHSGHQRHSRYLIRHLALPLFDANELEDLALVALYHRKDAPPLRGVLPGGVRGARANRVRRLVALLRLVDGLDEDHRQNVASVVLQRGKRQLLLEIRTVQGSFGSMTYFAHKAEFFEKWFGCKLVAYTAPHPKTMHRIS